MSNLLKLKAAFAVTASLASIVAGAEAQVTANSQLLAPAASETGGLVEKASASDIREFLEPLGIGIAPFDDGDDTAYTMMATTETGGQFLVTLFTCEDASTGDACEGLTSYAGFSNAGLAYDDLNRFNTQATVSKAINVEAQNAVIFGVQQYLAGGVSADNMQYVIVLFLNDLDNFMQAEANNATAVSHSAPAGESKPAKTDNDLTGAATMRTGAFGAYSLRGAVASAINNTSGVSFAVDAAR